MASDIDFDEVRQFFEFFEGYGVEYFFLEAMPRKLNGDRGAPVAKELRIEKAIGGTEGMVEYIKKLQKKLNSFGKIADLHIKESPGAKTYHRLLLVDDLELHFLEELANDYPGPIAGIETSPGNYQALLIAPRFPRGLLSNEVLRIQKSLAADYLGDKGAVAAGQLHRFAGSPNYKGCANGALPFFSRIEFLRAHKDSENCSAEAEEFLRGILRKSEQKEIAQKTQPAARAALSVDRFVAAQGRDETASGDAFRYAMSMLRRGVSSAIVTSQVAARWGAGRSSDWAARTVWNAQHALGMRATRYASGLVQSGHG